MVDTYPTLCGSVAGEASDLGVAIHEAGYEALDLDYAYVAMGTDDVGEAMDHARGMGFRGLGVSMPFKGAVVSHLDDVGEDVETIGACNTVVFEDGRATGHNTDWRGAMRALRETASLDVDRAEIVGAGGVARAIAYGLREAGVEVVVSARSAGQRSALVDDLALAGETDLDGQGRSGAELVVNATPVADLPGPVDLSAHDDGEWLLDVVFAERRTDLVEAAAERGWRVTPGWRMLLHQACEQFERYTGETAPIEPMGAVLADALGATKGGS